MGFIIPSRNKSVIDIAQTSIQQGIEFDFDFERKEYVLKNGEPQVLRDVEGIKVWIKKQLYTQFDKYVLYRSLDNEYGFSIEERIGRPNETTSNRALERQIKERMLKHKNIVGVMGIIITNQGSSMNVTFTCLLNGNPNTILIYETLKI